MRIGIVITSQKNFFGRRYEENPVKFLRDAHGLPVGRVEQGESRLGKFFEFFLKNFFKKIFFRVLL